MSSASDSNTKSPLDAAQKIVAELTGMKAEQQSLALKFAMETLGLKPPMATPSSAAVPSTQPPPPTLPHLASGADHSTDIRSFTAMKAPKSDQQFTAVVAYFYQFEAKPEDRKDVIDAEVMREAARLAGRAQVARWNMTLTNAKNAGYLDGAGNGKFKLSSVGENLVAITLPDGSPGQSKNNKARSKKKPAKKARLKKK
jgi:hypothetical protein